jgi:DNA polymerase-3 subunit epsilon/ATP-dependent DNA helicase DinG
LTTTLDRLPALLGSAAADAIERCREAGRRLFGDVKGYVGERLGGPNPGNATVALTDRERADPGFVAVLRAGRHAVATLTHSASVLEAAAAGAAVQAELLPQPERADDELALAATAVRELAAAIERIVCAPRDGFVAWLEMRAEQAELHEAPVSVAGALREHVFDRAEATVLTSATLAVAGSFEFLRHRVGIGDAAEELALASPFEYLSQALCVLPAGVPGYDEPDHETVIAGLVDDIVTRLGGHTLVLFTGYGPLKRVHTLLSERLAQSGLAVLGQGLDGTRRQILQNFLDDSRAVLLGTSSFWEGVDVPGERLRCVVIDKLPFPVPTDPLVRARTDPLTDPFAQYILPMAVIRLRQGFGRLIRGRADRGAVVLCDERLSTRDYGARFLEALPPAAVGRVAVGEVGAVVEAFVKQGAVPETVGQSTPWSPADNPAP